MHSRGGRVLSSKVHPVGESSNDDHSRHHDGFDVVNDQESSIPLGSATVVGGTVHMVVGVSPYWWHHYCRGRTSPKCWGSFLPLRG